MTKESTRLFRSYSNWAAQELSKLIKESDRPAMEVVEDFCMKMNRYSCSNPKSSYMFSVAYDVGMSVLDELLTKGATK